VVSVVPPGVGAVDDRYWHPEPVRGRTARGRPGY
jgi:hypothetical protein